MIPILEMRNLRYRKLDLVNDTRATGKNVECFPKLSPCPSVSVLPSFTGLSNLSITLGPYSRTWSPVLWWSGRWVGPKCDGQAARALVRSASSSPCTSPPTHSDTRCSFSCSRSQTPTNPAVETHRWQDNALPSRSMQCTRRARDTITPQYSKGAAGVHRCSAGEEGKVRGWIFHTGGTSPLERVRVTTLSPSLGCRLSSRLLSKAQHLYTGVLPSWSLLPWNSFCSHFWVVPNPGCTLE